MRTSPSNISYSLFFHLIFSWLISTYFWLSVCPSSQRPSRFTVVATLGALVLLSRSHPATVLSSEPHTELTTLPRFQSQCGVCLPLLSYSLQSRGSLTRVPQPLLYHPTSLCFALLFYIRSQSGCSRKHRCLLYCTFFLLWHVT